MKKLLIICLTLLAVSTMLLLTGCSAIFRTTGAGKIAEQTYDFSNFTGVSISDALQFDIKQADTYSVVVSAHENVFEHLDMHQSGDTLVIGMKFFPYNTSGIIVTINMPQLNKLAVSGVCDGTVSGFNSSSDLEISLSGASDLNTELKAGKTKLDISGDANITGNLTSTDTQIKLSGACDLNMILNTGKTMMSASGSSDIRGSLQALDFLITLIDDSTCELSGSAGNTVIQASGASEMDAPHLVLQSADVNLDGASDATIHTDGMLNIDISGASTLNYSGSPTMGKITVSGASDINHR